MACRALDNEMVGISVIQKIVGYISNFLSPPSEVFRWSPEHCLRGAFPVRYGLDGVDIVLAGVPALLQVEEIFLESGHRLLHRESDAPAKVEDYSGCLRLIREYLPGKHSGAHRKLWIIVVTARKKTCFAVCLSVAIPCSQCCSKFNGTRSAYNPISV